MDELTPGVDKPRRWQYPVGVLIIVALAALAYTLLRLQGGG